MCLPIYSHLYHHGSLSVTSVAYSLVRISGLVGHALTASIHGNHHDQWIRSVALSINRQIACDSTTLSRVTQKCAVRSDPIRTDRERIASRYVLLPHIYYYAGLAHTGLTVGLREEGLLFLFLSPSLSFFREVSTIKPNLKPLPAPETRATIQWKKVGFAWPFLFRESTSLLLATKKRPRRSRRRAFHLVESYAWC